ncbi:hypothetical protein [Streptacidiphilus melanogenes]|uniref:hypothetical protein n=1 Tax=Streptacidiphilus melanogenes TaxID=411235 RepID=UPI0005A91ED0|nr:hypothetical protein [Streptacidiphilus melanogenes]
MGLFRRSTSNNDSLPDATDDTLREIGRLVNAGDLDAADAIAQSTRDPRATAFAAYRYIDTVED